MSRHRTTAAILVALLAGAASAGAHAAVPRLVFPVVAKVSYTDDFGAPRGSGTHQGNDLMAAKKSKVVAVESGAVTKWTRSANAGCMLYLKGRSGTLYLFIHLNNDRTMRNDTHNNSTCKNGIAYAPGLQSGETVQAGELIGFVGDSGDADGIAPHLHFELHPRGGRAVSPYRWLRGAWHHLYARPPAAVTTLSATILGRVAYTKVDVDPDRIRVHVERVRLSNGWWVRPARDATISVPSGATVARRGENNTVQATTLGQAEPGEGVVVWTTEFAQTLAFARAAPGVHTARAVQLRGS
jgi:Peptidase family M23